MEVARGLSTNTSTQNSAQSSCEEFLSVYIFLGAPSSTCVAQTASDGLCSHDTPLEAGHDEMF